MLFTISLHRLLQDKQNKIERERGIILITCYAESLSSLSVWTQTPSRIPSSSDPILIHSCSPSEPAKCEQLFSLEVCDSMLD